ncbi:heat shock 70 kDa protein 12A-like [Dreissena polymorpha]|uniref:Heat shock 70 kDa protein 12A n=1 Tax=Dreissena polymorpha TaxID=45954 RepID=A0A9D4C380_DREPO|nr:heat shock 70 kDa protein 12A-like [Dreissena polymorpha]XP_052246898.1 heat shock 70 kDa protein 12A-like [Dreissena polymorpha]XP_052246899.1 heat shock 70 kDa protein 12A-like [Dreissena polymorpha]XP_052246900.1 heat shock 70 kDa protein 12A-like [Dreissena polymorpha]KAH3716326.1 hypothetical protein DPMN_059047 [Dreissena polymorpha]
MPGRQVVAAIDFGTTYSGYAYAYYSEFRSDPLKIYAYTRWSNEANLQTIKTPTTILFNKDRNFDSFGYEAEMKYEKLSAEDTHTGWRYFRRFKMKLYENEKRLRKNLKLYDDQGNHMPAVEVFGAAIRYLKDHALMQIRHRASDFHDTDIDWVLTVPAIWEDGAKQFMTLAANTAGIPTDQLMLAYEPEAAAIYCQHLTLPSSMHNGTDYVETNPMSKFLIVDLGGGTVDIAAYEMQDKGFISSLSSPSGGPWGGTVVDQEFRSFLESLFGKIVLDDMCTLHSLEMDHAIEATKRAMAKSKEDVMFKPPPVFDGINSMADVRTIRDRIVIGNNVFTKMFTTPIEKITDHVTTLLKDPILQGVKTILLVGGFAESDIIQNAMKDKFSHRYNVIIPEEAGLAILKGAVIYGQNPCVVVTRRLAFSYGISIDVPFDDTTHPVERRFIRNGKEMCENVFDVFVKKGDVVTPGVITVQRELKVPHIGATDIRVDVYKSGEDCIPTFITQCKKVGELFFALQAPSTTEQVLIKVQMSFGGTRVLVGAQEVNQPWNCVTAEFDWLM